MMSVKRLTVVNTAVPILGILLIIIYQICDTACSYLSGTFLGVDLKVVGILYLAALLVLNVPWTRRLYPALAGHLKTMLLSGALGGEVVLVRFQIVHDVYCPFCLLFGLCILVLFAVNFTQMNRYLALGAFFAGLAAFALFFTGAVLPLYS